MSAAKPSTSPPSSGHLRVRVAGILVALALAVCSQQILAHSTANTAQARQQILGIAVMIVAMALFGWAAPRPPDRGSAGAGERTRWLGNRPWAYLAALGAYALSLLLTLATGENAVVRLLWGAGLVLFVIAHFDEWRWPQFSRQDGWDLLVLAGIIAVGFILRYWRLDQIPSYIDGDVASEGLQAIKLLSDPNPAWFSIAWSNIPMFDFVMQSWSMRLFGTGLFGLSMTAVVQGTITIAGVYFLGREVFGRRVGLLAAALLSISYTAIHYSRIVATASPLPFLVFAFFFLFRGLHRQRSLWYALAGLCLGVGLMVYYPVRVSVVVIALLVVWLLIWNRRAILNHIGEWLAFAVGVALGFGPLVLAVLRDPFAFAGRSNEVTLLSPDVMTHLFEKYGTSSAAQVWIEQIRRTFLTFFLYGDTSPHFSFEGPLIDGFTVIVLLLGVGYCVRWLRDPRCFTLLAWVISTLFLGSIVTNDAPYWTHIVVCLPAVMVLAAIGAERAWTGTIAAIPKDRQPLANVAVGILVTFALVATGVQNWQVYTKWVGDNAIPRGRIARYLSQLPTNFRAVIVSDPVSWEDRDLQFFGQSLQGASVTSDAIVAGEPAATDNPTVFVLTPNHNDLLPALQAEYPNGEVREHNDQNKELAFTTLTVQPANDALPPGLPDPGQEMQRHMLMGWILAAVLLVPAAAAGLYLVLRPSPATVTPASASVLEPAPSPVQSQAAEAQLPVATQTTSTAAPQASSASVPTGGAIESRLEEPPIKQIGLTLAGMLVAILMAYVAQSLYDGEITGRVGAALVVAFGLNTSEKSLLVMGTVLYLVAMLLFALSAPGLPRLVALSGFVLPARGRPARTYPGELPPDARIHWGGRKTAAPSVTVPVTDPARLPNYRLQSILLGVAAAPFLLSMVLFWRRGEDAAVRWLWLAGLVLFLGGQVIWPAILRVAGPEGERSPRFRWVHVVILLAILGAGFWLRFNHLAVIPSDFHGDMASHGLQAREWLAMAEKVIFREGWANIPMKAFIPAAISLKLFGNDLFGLNMSAVIDGVLVLLAFYLLVWRLFDSHRLASLATALLAINIPHIHFSRLAEYMDPWPFMFFAVFFMVDGLRGRRLQSLALAGVLMGFGLEMYYSARVIAPILMVALVYLLIVRRQWVTSNRFGLFLLVTGILFALGPSLIYFAQNREAFVERSRAVWLFYEPVMTHLKGKYHVETAWQVLVEQTRISLLMFNHSIDSSTQFGFPHPMFSSLLSPLVLLGFGYGVRRWRHPALGLNLIWLSLILVMGGILTGDAPFWPRLIGILPAAAVFAALVLDRLWATIVQAIPTRRPETVNAALGVAALALLAYAGWQNWQLYFDTVQNNARPQARIGRYLASLPPEIAACDFADPYALDIRETAFQAYPRALFDIPRDAPEGLMERCPGPPLVWIVYPAYQSRLADLEARWPGGTVEEHKAQDGNLVFTSYLVTSGVPGKAAGASPTATAVPAGTAEETPSTGLVTGDTSTAYNPDGSTFVPEETFLGNTNSSTWAIFLGNREVTGGKFSLSVGPVGGHDAVYDYVELMAANGDTFRFEAEDSAVTTGDVYAGNEGDDGHWWLQSFDPFSAHQALVAQKAEAVPVITTTASVPDGVYAVTVGSFTGDPANGPFALGVRWQSP